MQKALFEQFYVKSIDTIAQELVSSNPEFSYHSNQNGIYEEYLNQRTMLKMLLKNDQGSNTSADAALLDGHKVAACITCAIIKVRLITSNDLEDNEDRQRYSLEKASRMNEQLALLSGLSCMIAFMLDDKKNLSITPLKSGEKLNLCLPETFYPKRSDYLSSLVRALYYTNTFSSINVLLLANIYFMIETYHRKSVEMELLKIEMGKSKDV